MLYLFYIFLPSFGRAYQLSLALEVSKSIERPELGRYLPTYQCELDMTRDDPGKTRSWVMDASSADTVWSKVLEFHS